MVFSVDASLRCAGTNRQPAHKLEFYACQLALGISLDGAEMEGKGISLDGFAPIWAWHSCEGVLHGAPTVSTARHLLSDLQIIEGICVVEFEAPQELCLLSSYGRFCELLDAFLDHETPESIAFSDMFKVPPLAPDDSIQAALPLLQMDWVLDIRHLDMKPDRWDYDWGKAV